MARLFGGVNNISCGNAAQLQTLTSATYAAWIQLTSDVAGGGFGVGICCKPAGAAVSHILGLSFTAPSLVNRLQARVVRATTNSDASALRLLNTNKLYFVAMTYSEADGVRIFLGDQLTPPIEMEYVTRTLGSGGTTSDATNNQFIGQGGAASVGTFPGLILRYMEWNTKLSLSHIQAWWAGVDLQPANNLINLPIWGLASPEPDLSGNGNNGTLTGTTAYPDFNTIPILDLATPGLDLLDSPFGLIERGSSTGLPVITGGMDNTNLILPRATDPTDPEDIFRTFNEAMQRLEDSINNKVQNQPACEVCPVLGAVTFDLSQCNCFVVNLSGDISNISVTDGPNGGSWCVYFVNNTGTDYTVGGWPTNVFLGGGSVGIGGNGGKSIKVPKGGGVVGGDFRSFGPPTTNSSGAPRGQSKQKHLERGGGAGMSSSMGGAGGGGIAPLKINGPNCFPCSDPTKIASYSASGGVPPYSWAVTAGSLSTLIGVSTNLTPAANPGSGVSGMAYIHALIFCGSLGPSKAWAEFNCDDSIAHNCSGTDCATPFPSSCFPPVDQCPANIPYCAKDGTNNNPTCGGRGAASGCPSGCNPAADGALCDTRTASMIAAGCSPCGITLQGAVLTLTDSRSISVTKTITTC